MVTPGLLLSQSEGKGGARPGCALGNLEGVTTVTGLLASGGQEMTTTVSLPPAGKAAAAPKACRQVWQFA